MGTVKLGDRYCEVSRLVTTDIVAMRVVIEVRGTGTVHTLFDMTDWVDLSPKAIPRLRKLVDKGLSPLYAKAHEITKRWLGGLAANAEESPCPATQKSQPPS